MWVGRNMKEHRHLLGAFISSKTHKWTIASSHPIELGYYVSSTMTSCPDEHSSLLQGHGKMTVKRGKY